MKIDDAYFGIMLPTGSWDGKGKRGQLRKANLFNSSRVKDSVARYVTMTPEEKKARISNPLSFCFGDVWGRCEYEFIVCPWPYGDDEKVEENGIKYDVYTLYVEPNAEHLMSIVDSISVSSAKKYLTEQRKRYRR